MEDTLSNLTGWLDKIAGAPALLTALILLGIGYAIKKTPWAHNAVIPWVVVLMGGIFFQQISEPTNNNLPIHTWQLRQLGLGLLIGFAVWIFHNQIWKRIATLTGIAPPDDAVDPPKPL